VEDHVRAARFEQLTLGDAQEARELGIRRIPAQSLGEHLRRRLGLQQQLLGGPPDVYLPALVAEVPLDLARYARLRVGREVVAHLGVEVVDRLEQADVPDLHQVLGRLGAVHVPANARPDQLLVPADQNVARRRAARAAAGQRAHDPEQLEVVEVVKLFRRTRRGQLRCRCRHRLSPATAGRGH